MYTPFWPLFSASGEIVCGVGDAVAVTLRGDSSFSGFFAEGSYLSIGDRAIVKFVGGGEIFTHCMVIYSLYYIATFYCDS